jgi:hypothetical protein
VAVVSAWFPLPAAPLLVDQAEPYLVPELHLAEFLGYLSKVGARSVAVDIAVARDVGDVVLALRAVLPFPDWCGSSWDSMEDAFEELRQAWGFPLVVVIRGLRPLIEERPHLALEVVLRLSGLSHAFSVAGDQFLVTYVDKSWA